MAQDSMFRVSQIAKDLEMKSTKELTAFLEGIGITDKKTSSVLTPEEFNLFFNELTRNTQISDFDDYMSKRSRIYEGRKSAVSEQKRKEKAEAEARAKAEAEAKA